VHQVRGVDAAFLSGETPEWHFHVSGLEILDPTGVPDFGFEKFRDVYAKRIHRVPQLRWRLVSGPFGVGWPFFIIDPDFNLDSHLHHIAVPPPGERRSLGRLVGDLIGYKIDRHKPLWEAWFIEGLEGGRAAVLTKIHHSIIDGQTGSDVATILFDTVPDPPPDPEPPPYEPEQPPSNLEVMARSGLTLLRTPDRMLRLSRQLVEQGIASAPFALRQPSAAMPFQAPRTPFNGQLTPNRSFASSSLPMATVKEIKNAAGMKVNDVVLATCAGGLRAELSDMGRLPDRPLIAQVPISTRTDDTRHEIGTQVASMFISLATHVADPLERLRLIHESSQQAKDLHEAIAGKKALNISDAVPPGMFSMAARMWSAAHLDDRTPPVYNLIVSNVAGPPFDLYCAGARVEAMYPLGPLLYGSGLNITVYSNGPKLDVGVMTCRELVADPWPLADRLVDALDELAAATLPRRRRARAPQGARSRERAVRS